MNHVRKYKLEITDLKKAKEVDYFVATEVDEYSYTKKPTFQNIGNRYSGYGNHH